MHTPEEAAAEHARLVAEHGPRYLCGLGISHRPFIDHVKEPGTYQKPVAHMTSYLDGLDAAATPLPAGDRVMAALGPKMLELAATRTAGTHPYLVTPELTAAARDGIGAGLVASEQGVVLETDPSTARAIARLHLTTYLGLPNYSNNWKRQGFTDDDIADGGSDRLVDALVVWGDEATIAAASRSSATPAPTTCASRCSPRTPPTSPSNSGGRWPRPSSDPLPRGRGSSDPMRQRGRARNHVSSVSLHPHGGENRRMWHGVVPVGAGPAAVGYWRRLLLARTAMIRPARAATRSTIHTGACASPTT